MDAQNVCTYISLNASHLCVHVCVYCTHKPSKYSTKTSTNVYVVPVTTKLCIHIVQTHAPTKKLNDVRFKVFQHMHVYACKYPCMHAYTHENKSDCDVNFYIHVDHAWNNTKIGTLWIINTFALKEDANDAFV